MPKHPLAMDVLVVVVAKLLVVVAAAIFVFGPGQRPKIDAGSIAMRLLGAPDVSPQPGKSSP